MLDSVVASANIADVISVCKSERDEVLMSAYNQSTANKILKLLFNIRKEFDFPFVRVNVENNIPLGAGLGASSADMAGVIIAVDELFSLNMGVKKRIKFADSTGCDTAFMLEGGCGRIINRSTVVDRFCMNERNAVIVVKGFCNTADVFRIYDTLPQNLREYDNSVIINALRQGEDIEGITTNVLTIASATINPNVLHAIEILGEGAMMSGSGSSVFALKYAKNQIDMLRKEGYSVFECKIGNFATQVIK